MKTDNKEDEGGSASAMSDWSYCLHLKREQQIACDSQLPSIVSMPQSIDAFRHSRMFDVVVEPLLKIFEGSRWLTVGDGCYGADAIAIAKRGGEVTATSLSDATLIESHRMGLIKKFGAENIERLSFADDSFDFVLCKEAYHHLPRPALGFYEMLRVCRRGVVFIEPKRAGWTPLGFLRTAFKLLTRRAVYHEYEPSGNYIYRLDLNEVVNMARTLDLPFCAYTTLNDFYHPKLAQKNTPSIFERLLFNLGIKLQDMLCLARLMSPGLLCLVVFKRELSLNERAGINRSGLKLLTLKRNPYLHSSNVEEREI